MDKNDFLEQEEKTIPDVLKIYIQKLRLLNKDEKKDWSKTDEFKKIVESLGELVPIKLLEDVTSYYKAKKQQLITKDIIAILDELDTSELVLKTGEKIKVDNKINIKTQDKKKLLEWLRDHDYESIISEVLSFPKGECTKELINSLTDQGLVFNFDSGVHPSTLKTVLKSLLENGGDVPPKEAVEIKPFRVAKIN